MRFVNRLCRGGNGSRCEISRDVISMSRLLFAPTHCNAFSERGRTAMRSKFFAAALRFELRVAGSSIVIVIRERKRI